MYFVGVCLVIEVEEDLVVEVEEELGWCHLFENHKYSVIIIARMILCNISW